MSPTNSPAGNVRSIPWRTSLRPKDLRRSLMTMSCMTGNNRGGRRPGRPCPRLAALAPEFLELRLVVEVRGAEEPELAELVGVVLVDEHGREAVRLPGLLAGLDARHLVDGAPRGVRERNRRRGGRHPVALADQRQVLRRGVVA